MRINFSTKFLKMLNKAPKKVQEAFNEKRGIFFIDYRDPVLVNHKLSGKLKHCRSINITGDWRAIYYTDNSHEVVVFILIGTHSELYK